MALEDVYARNLQHRAGRAGWLRAAVLGANDGLVSTASLMIGVVAAGKNEFLVTAGLAGITAGAMSMAVGTQAWRLVLRGGYSGVQTGVSATRKKACHPLRLRAQ